MDAERMVALARSWKGVPGQLACVLDPEAPGPLFGAAISSSSLTADDGCVIRRLEHVRVSFTVLARRRGTVHLQLKSPMGTTSKIIPKRYFPLWFSHHFENTLITFGTFKELSKFLKSIDLP